MKLKEKEGEVEEMRKLTSSKHEVMAIVEHDLAHTRSELMETEKKLSSTVESEVLILISAFFLMADSFCCIYKLCVHNC